MDEQTITRAAHAAVDDLKLDCQIRAVYKPPGKDKWCVQFTDKYGEFCDEFHEKSGRENSAAVIREKIKRHLFRRREMKTPGRRGFRTARSGKREVDQSGTPLKMIEGAIDQAAHVVSKAIDEASHLTAAVLDAAAHQIAGRPTAAEVPPARGNQPAGSKPRAIVVVAGAKSTGKGSKRSTQTGSKAGATTKKSTGKTKRSSTTTASKAGRKKGRKS